MAGDHGRPQASASVPGGAAPGVDVVGIGQFAEHWRDDQGGERVAKGEPMEKRGKVVPHRVI